MITIFGKKKKEDEKKDGLQKIPPQPQPPPVVDNDPNRPEESPFAKIFQSISQEYQTSTPPSRPERVGAPPLSVTPDWVQPRELPRSTPMVITPSGPKSGSPKEMDKDEEEDEGWEDKESKSLTTVAQPRPLPPPSTGSRQPAPRQSTPSQARTDGGLAEAKDSAPGPKESIQGPPTRTATMPTSSSIKTEEPLAVAPATAENGGKGKREDPKDTAGPRENTTPTFSEGLGAIDSSGDFSLSGFDDISKLLAETDSVLAQGRENEKELEREKPTPRKESSTPRKEPEQLATATPNIEKLAQNKQSPPSTQTDFKGFEHIFELAQGSLTSPGLALIDGAPESGKTTLCLGLADRYLKQGSPCIFVTYNQSPATVREELKKIGCDVIQYESNYRFMIIDAFTAQSGDFSMELYSLIEPWDISKLQETVIGNCAVFVGDSVRVIIDSLDGLVAKIGGKDFGKQFDPIISKLKESNATVIASLDLSKSGKDVKGWAEDQSDCLVEIELERGKDGKGDHSLTVDRANGTKVKSNSEEWDLQPGKGLVFV